MKTLGKLKEHFRSDDLEERKQAAGAAHLKLVDVVKVLETE
jgi:hypothetical protein